MLEGPKTKTLCDLLVTSSGTEVLRGLLVSAIKVSEYVCEQLHHMCLVSDTMSVTVLFCLYQGRERLEGQTIVGEHNVYF